MAILFPFDMLTVYLDDQHQVLDIEYRVNSNTPEWILDLTAGNNAHTHFTTMCGIDRNLYSDKINLMTNSMSQSYLLFKNHSSGKKLFVLYLRIINDDDGYRVMFMNYLEYLYYVCNSLENAHLLMNSVNMTKNNYPIFRTISEAWCFKLLYPIIAYTPRKFANRITSSFLYNFFFKLSAKVATRDYSKDFARNFYSRLYTSISNILGMPHVSVTTFIDSCVYKEYIDDTSLNCNILLEIKDGDLLSILFLRLLPK